MKQNSIFFLLLVAMVGCFSCTKVIDINLNNTAPTLVIQGNITNIPGSYFVTLSKSVNYNTSNVFPTVSGASVVIKDSTTGITDVLTETAPGTYRTQVLQGVVGRTYKLTVVAEGKTYTAVTSMPQQVPLDSVNFIINTGFGQTLINPVPNFQDPANASNNYRFLQSINGKLTKRIYVFDDRLSDGKYIQRQLFNDSAYIQLKDTIEVEMQCIDRKVYEYYKQLSGLDPTNGQPTSPTNPETNITGGALGYFSAHTVQRKKAVVK